MTEPAPGPPAAPDRPPVPTRGRSWLRSAYAAAGGLAIAGYVAASLLGLDVRTTERDQVPASARTSPGGYRSYHFWHSGYHGGK